MPLIKVIERVRNVIVGANDEVGPTIFLLTSEIHMFYVVTYKQNYLFVLTWVHLILGLGGQKLPIGQ
jgi:hypothetical protein